MKKWMYILGSIAIILVAVLVGNYIFKKDNKENINRVEESFKENVIKKEDVYSVKNDITIQTTTEEEKISPNATLVLKRHYKECDHFIKEYKEIPENLVNLTKEELEEKEKDWQIEKFSQNEVILLKEEAGICNEHFILKGQDGVIAVYRIENDVEELEELTGISIEYLTQQDKQKIQEGIKVYGREGLNSVLEDYE